MTWKGWEDYRAPGEAAAPEAPTKPKNKYHAQRTMLDGQRFDSTREANRYLELALLQANGVITDLQRQVPIALLITASSGATVCLGRWIADFVYRENNQTVYEDVKGVRTPLYRWKRRHVEAQLGITIRET